MTFKLLKANSNMRIIKETLGEYIENKSKQKLLNSSLIFQSFNGYHIDKFKISKGNARLSFLLNFIKEKHDEHSVNLIWNDLDTTKEIYKQDLLNTLCLISLPLIVKKGNQPIRKASLT